MRPEAALRFAVIAAVLALATTTGLVAQHFEIKSGDSAALPEVRAALIDAADGQSVEIEAVADREERPAAYASVDLVAGDRILAIGGKRVRTVEELQAAYDAVAVGADVELGVQRGERRWIERFPKADPAALPRAHRMEVRFEGNPEDITLLMGLGVILGRQADDSLEVVGLIPGEPGEAHFAKGDTLVSVNGKPVAKPAALQQLWDALPVGDEVTFELRRDGESRSFTVEKPELRGRMIRR
jgi:S1-C subfamily serine protease